VSATANEPPTSRPATTKVLGRNDGVEFDPPHHESQPLRR
jgi:hypothetical protein